MFLFQKKKKEESREEGEKYSVQYVFLRLKRSLHNLFGFLLEHVSTELVGCSKTKKFFAFFLSKRKKQTQDTTIIFLWGKRREKKKTTTKDDYICVEVDG